MVDGDLESADIDQTDRNFCKIQESGGNTTIVYPPYFFKGNDCCRFLSKELQAAVFLLDIYDGDFWSYTLYFNGEIEDKFMPVPDYFSNDLSEEEIDSWKGDAEIIAAYVPGIMEESIEKYLVRWEIDQEGVKAYEDDDFTNCEDQLFDFMRKLKLPYHPSDMNGTHGQVYKFWSEDLPLEAIPVEVDIKKVPYAQPNLVTSKPKAWWEFW